VLSGRRQDGATSLFGFDTGAGLGLRLSATCSVEKRACRVPEMHLRAMRAKILDRAAVTGMCFGGSWLLAIAIGTPAP
jgi:hypothetical protein